MIKHSQKTKQVIRKNGSAHVSRARYGKKLTEKCVHLITPYSLCSDNCKRLTYINSVICSHAKHFRKHLLLKKNKENTVTINLEVLREPALFK